MLSVVSHAGHLKTGANRSNISATAVAGMCALSPWDISNTGIIVESSVCKSQKPGSEPSTKFISQVVWHPCLPGPNMVQRKINKILLWVSKSRLVKYFFRYLFLFSFFCFYPQQLWFMKAMVSPEKLRWQYLTRKVHLFVFRLHQGPLGIMSAISLSVDGSYTTTIIILTQQLSWYLTSIFPSLIISSTCYWHCSFSETPNLLVLHSTTCNITVIIVCSFFHSNNWDSLFREIMRLWQLDCLIKQQCKA